MGSHFKDKMVSRPVFILRRVQGSYKIIRSMQPCWRSSSCPSRHGISIHGIGGSNQPGRMSCAEYFANFVDNVGAYMPCQAGTFVAMKFWKWKSKETHCGLWRRKHIVIRQLCFFQWYIFKMQQMHTIKADYDQQSLLETTVLFVRVVIYGNASILMTFRYVARMTNF